MRRERSWSLFPQIQATNLPLAPASILPDLKVKVKSLSHVSLFATLWTVAHQAPPPMGFSRQEYWSGFLFPSPGIEPGSPPFQADSLQCEPSLWIPRLITKLMTFWLLSLFPHSNGALSHWSSWGSLAPSRSASIEPYLVHMLPLHRGWRHHHFSIILETYPSSLRFLYNTLLKII